MMYFTLFFIALLPVLYWAAYVVAFPHDIRNGDRLYLRRWIVIRCRWFRVFVHRIYLPDSDRNMHNHPWPTCYCLILRGGYQERWVGAKSGGRRRTHNYHGLFGSRDRWGGFNGCVNHLQADSYHKIVSVLPGTLTLVFAGRRSRDWGFLTDNGHVPWRTYLDLSDTEEIRD